MGCVADDPELSDGEPVLEVPGQALGESLSDVWIAGIPGKKIGA
jgi:hypothetical protein